MEDGEKPMGNSHGISDKDDVVCVQAIRELPLFYKDTPENIGMMVDILVQILGFEEFVEHDVVHKALMSLLRQDVKGFEEEAMGVYRPGD
ncbi:Apoptosis inhibitor 5-like protein [Vigna angularis]|uniref:Apoptosis inhibitor 5-like protein n=1 Tax=Phaseolus angularis TaxID=3914 RepID=A0A8T0JRE9_PHAAN|nr:Apoptosis inhibitor 5-like protein [Vigna angularis]